MDSNLAFDNANGIIGMHYISPTEWDISIPGYPAGQPAYSVLIAALMTALGLPGVTVDSIPTAEMAAAVVASAPYDQNGLHQLSYNTYFWYGNRLQMYPAVPYSTLPGGTYHLLMEYSVDNQIEQARSTTAIRSGESFSTTSPPPSATSRTTARASGPTTPMDP